MSGEPIRIPRKELSSGEVIDRLDDGQRVTVDVIGTEKDVVLRKTGEEYVCDTGPKLLAYEDREGTKRCIERLRLAESGWLRGPAASITSSTDRESRLLTRRRSGPPEAGSSKNSRRIVRSRPRVANSAFPPPDRYRR